MIVLDTGRFVTLMPDGEMWIENVDYGMIATAARRGLRVMAKEYDLAPTARWIMPDDSRIYDVGLLSGQHVLALDLIRRFGVSIAKVKWYNVMESRGRWPEFVEHIKDEKELTTDG